MTVSILVKMVAIAVCCLSCVTFLVNLLDAAGIKEIIFIECHCKHLHFHYFKSLKVTMSFIFQTKMIMIFLKMIKKTKNSL